MERIIKTLTKRDLKTMGLSGKFKAVDIQNKLIEHFKDHMINTEINETLAKGLNVIDLSDECKVQAEKPKITAIVSMDENSFKDLYPNAIKVIKYGEWKFDNVFYDDNTKVFYEKIKDMYRPKNLQTINRKESAISVKDSSGVRRYIYIDKFASNHTAE
jgi:hypothetical protein